MKKWLVLLVACLALGLLATGCGSDDDEDSGASKAEPKEQPADTGGGSGGASAGGAVKVSLKNISFNPKSVTVSKGDTITWTNDESVPHDVTKEDGPGPDFTSGNGNLKQGDTYKQTFDTAGTINYVCTVHPNMTATVTVK